MIDRRRAQEWWGLVHSRQMTPETIAKTYDVSLKTVYESINWYENNPEPYDDD